MEHAGDRARHVDGAVPSPGTLSLGSRVSVLGDVGICVDRGTTGRGSRGKLQAAHENAGAVDWMLCLPQIHVLGS